MSQWMLAIWSVVPLSFLNPACTSGIFQFTYCWIYKSVCLKKKKAKFFFFNRISLVVQGQQSIHPTQRGVSSIPGRGTKIPLALQCGQKMKKHAFKKEAFLHLKLSTCVLCKDALISSFCVPELWLPWLQGRQFQSSELASYYYYLTNNDHYQLLLSKTAGLLSRQRDASRDKGPPLKSSPPRSGK